MNFNNKIKQKQIIIEKFLRSEKFFHVKSIGSLTVFSYQRAKNP